MIKEFKFGRSYTMTVKNEKLSGVLLDLTTLKKDANGDEVVCNILDLNKFGLDIKVTRKGQPPVYMHQGFLDDFLIGMFAQTTLLEIAKKKFSNGYSIVLDFSAVLDLNQGDTLDITVNGDVGSFDGLDKSISDIVIETIPSTQEPTILPMVKVSNIGNGETTIDKQFPDDMLKLVLVTDYDNPYDQSNKAKVASSLITGMLDAEKGGVRESYKKDATENLLIAQNRNMFDNNPESDVKNLVLFSSENYLDEARLKAKLTKPADEKAKVISVHMSPY